MIPLGLKDMSDITDISHTKPMLVLVQRMTLKVMLILEGPILFSA